ncbi:MAG: thiamine-phosphate kinase, partial [Microbacteriaceae bacterium]
MSMERPGGSDPSRATLGGLGELEVLDRITRRLPAATSALLGPGDDAAVVAAPDGRFVTTTDLMVHGPDFRLAWSSGHDLG